MASTRNFEHTWEMSSWVISCVVNDNASYTSQPVKLEEFESRIVVIRRGDSLVLRSKLKLQDDHQPLPDLMLSSKSCIDIAFIYERDGRQEAHMKSSRHSFTEKTAVWEFDNIIPAAYFQRIVPDKDMELHITQQITLHLAADNTQNVTPQQQLSKKATTAFATLLQKGDFSDIVLVSATGKEFKAHKSIISASSSEFAAFLESGMKESNGNRVKMENVSDELMEAMLKVMYTGILDGQMRPGFYEELLAVADQYVVTDLRRAVLNVIQVDMDNFGRLLVLSDRHGNTNLRSRVFEFISLNRDELKYREGSIF